jgi:hypothetical protein
MAEATATIRVRRRTRDLLAEQARDRGVSLSAMLDEIAHEVARQALLRSERDAARADASSRGARNDERVWEAALGDGLD